MAAMNTKMWEHPSAIEHRISIIRLAQTYKITTVVPVPKRLACGEEGVGAMANIEDIAREVQKATC